MASRGQSLTIAYVACDTAANAGKTGDAANQTLRWIKDGASVAPAASPVEVDSINAPGVYTLSLSAAECTCHVGVLAGKSSTANVVIIPITIAFEQLPTATAGTNGGLSTADTNGRVKADLEAIDGLDTSGNNATLHLKQLSVVNATGSAIVASGGGGGYDIEADIQGTLSGPVSAIASSEHEAIADVILGRGVGQIESTAEEHSLCTVVLALLESSVNDVTWTINRTDGTTTHATKNVTRDSNALPITGVNS